MAEMRYSCLIYYRHHTVEKNALAFDAEANSDFTPPQTYLTWSTGCRGALMLSYPFGTR